MSLLLAHAGKGGEAFVSEMKAIIQERQQPAVDTVLKGAAHVIVTNELPAECAFYFGMREGAAGSVLEAAPF